MLKLAAQTAHTVAPNGKTYRTRELRLPLRAVYDARNSWAFVRQRLLASGFALVAPKPSGEPRLSGADSEAVTENGELVYRQRYEVPGPRS